MYRFASPDKRRPVLVLSRNDALEVMETALVTAITSTRRGSPAEVALDVEHGLKRASAANLDNVFTVRQAELRSYVSTVPPAVMVQVCRALALATGCR
jgi:mRNA interferase MazF